MHIATAKAEMSRNGATRYAEAAITLLRYMKHAQPMRAESKLSWSTKFDRIGPFWASVYVEEREHNPQSKLPPLSTLRFRRLTSLQFDPPATLYRAGSKRGRNGMSWTPSYQIAQRIANSRGKKCSVWSTTPAHVYGCIDVERTDPQIAEEFRVNEQFTIWIIEPGTTELVDRWRDPELGNYRAPEWADRGTTKDEADALLRAWCAYNPNERSAGDNFGREFWQQKFSQIGQFTADATFGQDVRSAPTRNLKPEGTLYRAARDKYAHGIAWTTELHAAEKYQEWRGKGTRLWTAEAEHIYGRIRWNGYELGGPYWEWLIEPKNVRPLEVTE